MQRILFTQKETGDQISLLCIGHEIDEGHMQATLISGIILSFPAGTWDPYSLLVVELTKPPGKNDLINKTLYRADLLHGFNPGNMNIVPWTVPEYEWQNKHQMLIIKSTIVSIEEHPYMAVSLEAKIHLFDNVFFVQNPKVLQQGLRPDTLYVIMGNMYMTDINGFYQLAEIPIT